MGLLDFLSATPPRPNPRAAAPEGVPLRTPAAYQGGKVKFAGAILDRVRPDPGAPFHDLCCGSGSVAVAAFNRGHPARLLHMVDAGPWGDFWRAVGEGTFDLAALRRRVRDVPANQHRVHDHVLRLAAEAPGADRVAVFLLLQAAAFGGTPVYDQQGRWRYQSFRGYWLPTPTSVSRSPGAAMAPQAPQLYERVARICAAMRGLRARRADVADLRLRAGVAYLDPPYRGRNVYGYSLPDPAACAARLGVPCWVSESRPLGPGAVRLSGPLTGQGGVRGGRATPHAEWLTPFGGAPG